MDAISPSTFLHDFYFINIVVFWFGFKRSSSPVTNEKPALVESQPQRPWFYQHVCICYRRGKNRNLHVRKSKTHPVSVMPVVLVYEYWKYLQYDKNLNHHIILTSSSNGIFGKPRPSMSPWHILWCCRGSLANIIYYTISNEGKWQMSIEEGVL